MKFNYRNYAKAKRRSIFKHKKHARDFHDSRSIIVDIMLELLIYVPRLIIRLVRAIID